MGILETKFEQLKQDIIVRAGLGSQEATGFHSLYCPICGKSDRKTGGFKFEHDKIGYHCFRGSCDAQTVYELGKPIPRKFKRLMETVGVKIPAELLLIKSSFQKNLESLDESLYKEHYYKSISTPEGFVKYSKGKKVYQEIWDAYFEERKCSTDDVYIANNGKYAGCCAVKMCFYDKTIGYQIITHKGDYINYFDGNKHVMYIPEAKIPETVILVEGLLDAKCFPNTIGTLHSEISPQQAYQLRGKNVIMLPDFNGTNNFINQFIDYGWKISIPDWAKTCKDLNKAVMTYGVINAADMIMKGVCNDRITANVKMSLVNGFDRSRD